VRKLANGQLGPNSLAGVERRCALGARLTAAGLLPEANAVFATALRAGKTPARGTERGCRHGLRALRIRRARALRLWRDARLAERLGTEDTARSRYIDALRLDSALAGATAGLKRVGSHTVHSTAADITGDVVTDVSEWLEDAAGWAKDRPTTLVGAALVLGGLALLAAAMFFWLISHPGFSGVRRTLTWWPLRRFTETNTEVVAIAGGDGMSSVLANVLLLTPAAGGYGIDAQPPSPDILGSAADEVAAAVPQLAGFAAVLTALRRLIPRRRFTVRGELVPVGPNGLGLAVYIADWRGRRSDSRTFWQIDWAPGVADDAAAKYQLAEAAGWWVRWRLEP
jgi:hypothetical protein